MSVVCLLVNWVAICYSAERPPSSGSITEAPRNLRPPVQISNVVPTLPPVAERRIRPQLTVQPADIHVQEGERVYMNCAADGEPRPKIAWFHNE